MNNEAIVKQLFNAIDNMDADKFATFLSDDVTFKFGNDEAVTGNPDVRKYVGGFFSAIGNISHTIDTYVEDDDKVFFREEVSYTRKDSTKLIVPFANFLLFEDGKIKIYQIYTDTSQLFGV